MSSELDREDGLHAEQVAQEIIEPLQKYTWEVQGPNIYAYSTDGEASIGGKLAEKALSRGFAVSACVGDTLKLAPLTFEGAELAFDDGSDD